MIDHELLRVGVGGLSNGKLVRMLEPLGSSVLVTEDIWDTTDPDPSNYYWVRMNQLRKLTEMEVIAAASL